MKLQLRLARRVFIPALFAAAVLAASCGKKEDTPLVIAIDDVNGKFSPFTSENATDGVIAEFVTSGWATSLISVDRNGEIVYQTVAGETREYNGKPYTYTGLCDTTVSYDESSEISTYHYKVREGVKFSDGVELTADDVIFSLYVFSDPSYDGNATIFSLPILGMEEYRGGKADYIRGITKINQYEVEVLVQGLNSAAIWRMSIVPAPLHYYGSKELYDYEAHRFGFPRGDISLIKSKDGEPMGAGPYKFVKFDNKVVYLEANELYWKGAPKIKSLQLKITSPSDTVTAVTTGAVDISEPSNSKEKSAEIRGYNKNGELTGDTLTYLATDYLGYGYIGINPRNVSVGGKPASAASKNLRKALATIIAIYRDVAIESYFGDTASVINYPISNTSWAAPRPSEPDYHTAYSVDVNGGEIYTASMSADERYAAAKKAALGFLEAAGYTLNADKTKATAAPSGAKLSYDVMIGTSGTADHPTYLVLSSAKEALDAIGIALNIQDIDFSVEVSTTRAGNAQLWVMSWAATADPDMYQVYHSSNAIGKGSSSNIYCIEDAALDGFIEEGRRSFDNNFRRGVYHAAMDRVLDWAVEVPIYQRQDCTLFSTKRVNIATLPSDMTTYYSYVRDIATLKMR